MHIIETILSLLVTLGILVTIHEYGHFWVARRCGVRVLRFSVGFGKPLWSRFDRHGTEFAVAAIPLGGYVKMLDEREGPVPADQLHLAFNRQTPIKRIAIASAGPIANFLFAIFAYWILSVVGFTTVAPVVGTVKPQSLAAQAGLQNGDEITYIDGQTTPSWRQVSIALLERAGEHGTLTLETSRDGQTAHHKVALNGWSLTGGEPDPIALFGIQPWQPDIAPVIGEVLKGQAAASAGLMAGDRVLSVDGHKIDNWAGFVGWIKKSAGQTLDVVVSRSGRDVTLRMTPREFTATDGKKIGHIGAAPKTVKWPEKYLRKTRYNPLTAIPNAVAQTWDDTHVTLVAIGKMLTGMLSIHNISGPITIARVAEASVSSGFEDFIGFLAYVSISLGVLNLLPVPVLDGGHILYYGIEAIRGKPLSESAQEVGMRIGIALIFTLMVIALYNDLMRL
ncbi:sigma E protease regulator RseP [Mangrovitalea sediminis]|uniref:sigma E protease regulator RseP n=1 Tax=Mangrovitalea sediminis TaxID=1982043 RepID=UPI000BE61294|nr:sigma E protease regulator RseP [Mangrovitalea sediminis]